MTTPASTFRSFIAVTVDRWDSFQFALSNEADAQARLDAQQRFIDFLQQHVTLDQAPEDIENAVFDYLDLNHNLIAEDGSVEFTTEFLLQILFHLQRGEMEEINALIARLPARANGNITFTGVDEEEEVDVSTEDNEQRRARRDEPEPEDMEDCGDFEDTDMENPNAWIRVRRR